MDDFERRLDSAMREQKKLKIEQAKVENENNAREKRIKKELEKNQAREREIKEKLDLEYQKKIIKEFQTILHDLDCKNMLRAFEKNFRKGRYSKLYPHGHGYGPKIVTSLQDSFPWVACAFVSTTQFLGQGFEILESTTCEVYTGILIYKTNEDVVLEIIENWCPNWGGRTEGPKTVVHERIKYDKQKHDKLRLSLENAMVQWALKYV